MALSWTHFSVSLVLNPRCVLPVMNRGEGSHPLSADDNLLNEAQVWFLFPFFSTEMHSNFLWNDHHAILFVGPCSSPVNAVHGTIPAQTQSFALPFIEFQEILVNSFLQPVEAHPLVCTLYNMAYDVSATPLSFVSSAKLLRMHIVASVHSSDLYFLSFSVRETVKSETC